MHAANSAGLLAFPDARFDLVRVGIAIYGIPPVPELAGVAPLRPALSLKARVSHVKVARRGQRASPTGCATGSTGRPGSRPCRSATPTASRATSPRSAVRSSWAGARRPVAGTVTMDQLMVDVGDDAVEVGDEVVLIGRQGDAEVTAQEWAERLGTIAYEIVCGIGPRAPRRYT